MILLRNKGGINMPTEKPRVTITMSQEQLSKIDEYRFGHKIKNQTQAILSLIDVGLTDIFSESDKQKEKAPPFSGEAMQIAKDYDFLDSVSQKAVRSLVDIELTRSAASPQAVPAPMVDKIVYINPAAAGVPLYAESDYERIEFPESDVPRGADFGIRIAGDSMEPTIPDETIVWVRKTSEIYNNQIGVFMLDDTAVCKRYFKEEKNVRLLSDNPAYEPIEITDFERFGIVGRVLEYK